MDHQSAEIARPGESPFEFPPILAALRDFGRLFPARFTISAVRNQEANSFASQSDAQFVRIINLIPDEGFGPASGAAATLAGDFNNLQGLFCQLYFPGRCRGNGASQRNTLAVEHHHPFRALAPPSFADFGAPFFTGAKLASMKASSQSKSPDASNCDRKMRQIFNHSSPSFQRFSRRQQLQELGYCRGRSCQYAPVRNIHRMPSRTSRLLLQGRPPLNPGLSEGSNGAIMAQWSSIRNFGAAAIGLPPIAYYAKTHKMYSISPS
jgi:hypothetical protein